MKTITLKNSFHGTEARISSSWGDTPAEVWDTLQTDAYGRNPYSEESRRAQRTIRRIERALCGMDDCRCGTVR